MDNEEYLPVEIIMKFYKSWHPLYEENIEIVPEFIATTAHNWNGGDPCIEISKKGDHSMFSYLTIECADDDELSDKVEYWRKLLEKPINPVGWSKLVIDAKCEEVNRLAEERTKLNAKIEKLSEELGKIVAVANIHENSELLNKDEK